MAVNPVYLPPEVEAGAVGRLKTSTEVQTGDDASEFRMPRWFFPVHEWTLSYGPEFVDEIEDMFEAHLGAGYCFLFRPPRPRDYTVTGETIGTGDGATLLFKLTRTVTVGNLSSARDIKHPRVDTAVIKVDGVPTPDVSISASGQVLFVSAPADGVVITADFEFDTAVRFSDDTLETTMSDSAVNDGDVEIIAELRSITVVEVPNE